MRSPSTTPPRGVRLTSARRGTHQPEGTDQSANIIELTFWVDSGFVQGEISKRRLSSRVASPKSKDFYRIKVVIPFIK